MAATTIQVEQDILAALRQVKEEIGAPSYNEVLRRLLMDRAKRRERILGIAKGIGPYVRERGQRD